MFAIFPSYLIPNTDETKKVSETNNAVPGSKAGHGKLANIMGKRRRRLNCQQSAYLLNSKITQTQKNSKFIFFSETQPIFLGTIFLGDATNPNNINLHFFALRHVVNETVDMVKNGRVLRVICVGYYVVY